MFNIIIGPKFFLGLAIFIGSSFFIFYALLKRGENIKVDHERIEKIKKSAKYLEGMVDKKLHEFLVKNTNTSEYINKLEKMLVESRLRYLGLTSIYVFFIISAAIGFIAFRESIKALNNPIAAVLLGAIATWMPFEGLKLEVDMQRRSIRRHLPHFFLTILQLFEGSEDIIEVMESSVDKFKNPLKSHFKTFLVNYKSGMDISTCVKVFKSGIENPLLQKFADDIESNMKNGTKLKGIISEYVIKAYDNQINYAERITENSGSLTAGLMLVGIMGYIVYTLNKVKPELLGILTTNTTGKVTVNIVIIMMVVIVKIMGHSISYKDTK